ncbi:peroxisomal 2,4-dienoyl-CoA reductase [(3E)-enoyl-CoA-producing]-like [Lethenteron reissneri]|uniref:peroxisomal 2,4-dienoyl-CoA reductase [(3E)-enoyl-CoA-producing] n=1 Tax=Lethenteron reissneri TaxID=7753 RepID=UPI002AB733F5|nr:peroxisomal 2,4-dienoyl-CoA reductase [(3E)-enoyl-CoA-producing] [Lethenteron reissneri]XP_061414788.1 peroxisomal 2,4-dienoyl-CoA reductase [(3E)-enoyl-CoA-producing] [Lethenteron reissneri]XP_061415440.1 peroxisomal 2,4-dienoyl-CoA reductase [(3E)-enoyl-CoA-producing]-like [Lethenteron reissneri]
MSQHDEWSSAAAADVDTDDCLPSYTHLYSPTLLKGRVAFITGGGSGIGFRIAELFMRHGCDTIIASRNKERVEEAARKLRQATGQSCVAVTLDVRDETSIERALDLALERFPRIHILVNNAAGNFVCPMSNLTPKGFRTVMDIDTMGTFNSSLALYRRCFKEHGGVIVNISATISYRGQMLQVHAGAAKAANDAMTKHMAVEWGPDKVRINSLAPGPISGTEGMRRLGGHLKGQNPFASVPLGRAGTKTDMAHCALFLASPLASYVTGSTLVADGGAWMTSSNDFNAVRAGLVTSKM